MIINLSNCFNLILFILTIFIALLQLKNLIFYKYYIELNQLNNL